LEVKTDRVLGRQEGINVKTINKISSLDWTNITKPQREDEKFEFQFCSRHSLSVWSK
jgi:chemotaxis signal transduction protein